MTQTIKATYENGVLKPKEPLALVEGTEVELTITTPTDDQDPLAGVIGIGHSGRTDGAEQHDHYIYGTPKRSDLR
jgi:predicted DNA-binding antitoxin AbrB/MazE fold protein